MKKWFNKLFNKKEKPAKFTKPMLFNGKKFILTYENNKVIEDENYKAYVNEVASIYRKNWTL